MSQQNDEGQPPPNSSEGELIHDHSKGPEVVSGEASLEVVPEVGSKITESKKRPGAGVRHVPWAWL